MGARDNVRHALIWLVHDRFDGNQTEFSKDLGVTKQKANNWMVGVCAPDLEMVGKIAKKYGLSLDWMIGGDVDTAPDGYVEYAIVHFDHPDD